MSVIRVTGAVTYIHVFSIPSPITGLKLVEILSLRLNWLDNDSNLYEFTLALGHLSCRTRAIIQR